jgi:hypothetical protein
MVSVFVLAVCLLAPGCGSEQKPAPSSLSATAPVPVRIERLEPSSTAVDKPFNPQKDGQAALAVFGTDLPGGSAILWNGQPLQTSGGGTFVAGVVPAALYASPGVVSVSLRGPNGAVSNTMDFTIYGKTGPEPKVTELYPGATAPGKGFNLQPNGQSALGVSGEGFLPGVTLMFDGKKLTTVFGKGTGLSAIVPAGSIASAGTHQVWAVNPDGKASNKVVFKVAN